MNVNDTIKKEEYLGIDSDGTVKKIAQNSLQKPSSKEKPLNLSYLNVGYYLVIPLLLGVFLGFALDSWLKTKPLFVSLGIMVGTIACFYNLLKLLKNE
ncbi:hypothetical protein A2866_04145 [Candidatus Roizmanbacteria bacterium RIFCSPHIGHO2_01_FULL_39_8]|uniref:ATP synthase subunit n=3 Tax=Candidatus Roizmaniibacteriota TaxID=1752723 RepID=A0A1F7GFD4_9BACT|nr:MAG: hypothetical protein A2866_04145 [Candidatus Roizmanbacteria bacterium RIFCSPHIGHO2_01_FULL_39_8]OGK28219.1 MAG: hypothetical protein A3C28_05110 [Candidatus Roizmanbacteria bacterium RIFCSPHIGHO2_02_FULL_39_9]OGK35758.1 MAG: hypothetical protein A3F60_01590 [Candidatus Roizmanbacteria bacterium RIFCSPHIGHO2_12_FULL_39_8]